MLGNLCIVLLFLKVFSGDGGEVQLQWVAYTEQMDRMVEEALRLNVKWSLQELSHAINGDGKTIPDPIFKVKVILTEGIGIEFSPSIDQVAGYISSVSGELINTISIFRRLPEILAHRKAGKDVSVAV